MGYKYIQIGDKVRIKDTDETQKIKNIFAVNKDDKKVTYFKNVYQWSSYNIKFELENGNIVKRDDFMPLELHD